jgi:peptidoglycan-N-acetylglucosamine deacetylase
MHKELLDRVRPATTTGRRLAPDHWPGDARVAVAITFDLDNEFPLNAVLPLPVSTGAYGGFEGLPRVLRLLDQHQIPGSFYVPGASAILQPQMLPSILESGRHEIGLHGWEHELVTDLAGRDEEGALLQAQIEFMQRETGRKPAGYRAPSLAISVDTPALLCEAGILYDSSLVGMDDCYELLSQGEPTATVEVPNNWLLIDYYYLHMDDGYQGVLPSPEAVYEVYAAEFEGAWEEGGLFMLTLHPHVIGRRSRIRMLDRLLTQIRSRPGVWFATVEEIARYVAVATGCGGR